MIDKPPFDRRALFLRVAAALQFAAVLLASPMTAAQSIDPNIQMRRDSFADRPSGTDLIVKQPVTGQKKPKARPKSATRPRVKSEQRIE
jgi:hypothetical protein